jgi:hypothetical protein
MKTKMPYLSLLVACDLAIIVAACGSTNDKKQTCTEAKSLCASLVLPSSFSGKTTLLMALFFKTSTPAGMPDAFLATVSEPGIDAAHPYALKVTDIAVTGTFYFYAALYMEGGGTMEPVAGVDYVGTAGPLNVDGLSAINLGDIQMNLYQKPD